MRFATGKVMMMRGVTGLSMLVRRQGPSSSMRIPPAPEYRTAGTNTRAFSTSSSSSQVPTNELGEEDDGGQLIGIRVTQKKYKVDETSVRDTISKVSHYLGVGDFQVDVWYCSEDKIRELNDDWRGKRKSTDVLSFPANEFTSPMVFDENDPTLRHMKHLGDIIVAPAYVHRQMERDRKVYSEEGGYNDYEEDAGVSRAMASEFSLERRLDLLLLHSILHLLGYDHETPREWKEMTAKEEEIMAALKL